MQNKLAVILPGMGYHKDKPLLYYAAKLAKSTGFQITCIEYRDMPEKIRADADMLLTAAQLAYQQTEEQLRCVDWSAYDEVLLIGKSIGTVAAAKYAAEKGIRAKQIRYTPLHAAFDFPAPAGSCIAFLGEADNWSDIDAIKQTAAAQQIPLYLYPECNHSLECADVIRNIENLHQVMQITAAFIEA